MSGDKSRTGEHGIQATYRLSPMQEGMLYHYLSAKYAGVDIEQIVVSVQEPLDVDALDDAWQRAAQRHPALRTARPVLRRCGTVFRTR